VESRGDGALATARELEAVKSGPGRLEREHTPRGHPSGECCFECMAEYHGQSTHKQDAASPTLRTHIHPSVQAREGEYVFTLPSRGKLDTMLKLWAGDAGLDKRISFHKARHTFATLAVSAGVDIYTLSKLLGHASGATTQIYAQVGDEHKKKAVEMLPTLSDVSRTKDRAS